jgi:hypothetical protein
VAYATGAAGFSATQSESAGTVPPDSLSGTVGDGSFCPTLTWGEGEQFGEQFHIPSWPLWLVGLRLKWYNQEKENPLTGIYNY